MSQIAFNLVLDFMRLGANDLVTCDGEDWHVRLVARMSACCTDANLDDSTKLHLERFVLIQELVEPAMRRYPEFKKPELGDMWTVGSGDRVSRHIFLGFCSTGTLGLDARLAVLVETMSGERQVEEKWWFYFVQHFAVVTKYCGTASRRTYPVHPERFLNLTASYSANGGAQIIRLDAFHMGRFGSAEGRMLEGTIVSPVEKVGTCFRQDLNVQCDSTEFQRDDHRNRDVPWHRNFNAWLKVLDAIEDLAVQPFGPHSATQDALRGIALESLVIWDIHSRYTSRPRHGICMGHSPRGILVRLSGETLLAGETWLIRYVDVRKVTTYMCFDEVTCAITL